MSRRYVVHKISTLSLAKFGCILGGVAMLLPGLVCAVGSTRLITIVRTFLENSQASELDLLGLGAPIEFDFIALLDLEAAQALINRLDDQRLIVAMLIILTAVIGGGLLIGLSILLLGWIYNALAVLTGGLEVELRGK